MTDVTDKPNKLKPLSKKHQRVLDEYVKCFNQYDAYSTVYTKTTYDSAKASATRLFTDVNFKEHLQARLDEIHIGANEALKLQADIARGNIGIFFKPVDEWMFNPLPEYEILDMKEVIDDTKTPPVTRISYRVFHVVLDMDKVMNPQYSHLIKKFSNSRKNGLSIELYSRQDAIRDALKVHGKFTDHVDLSNSDGTLKPIVNIYIPSNGRNDTNKSK